MVELATPCLAGSGGEDSRPGPAGASRGQPGRRGTECEGMRERLRRVRWGSRHLLAGGWVGLRALGAAVFILGLVTTSPGVGLLLLPVMTWLDRRVANAERRRAGALLGRELTFRYAPGPDPEARARA
ncbi:MAG: sensor domain-containing protein, partial [Dactylosporangium sp.]|nr:sensor domain-containing protein [Dactylosporangium sp.]